MIITTKPSEDSKFFKSVYVNGKCMGSIMADDKMTPKECYEELKNNWAISKMEMQSDLQIDRNSNY